MFHLGAACLEADLAEREELKALRARERASPGMPDIVYRDVFPGAIPFELLKCEAEGRVVTKHKGRRAHILAKGLFLPIKGGGRRPIKLLRTGPVLAFHQEEIDRTPVGERCQRCESVGPQFQLLHSFDPCPHAKSLPAGERELDDGEISRVLLAWIGYFRPCHRARIIDVVVVNATLCEPNRHTHFAGLGTPKDWPEGLRFQLMPLNLIGRKPPVRGMPDVAALLDILHTDGLSAEQAVARGRLMAAEAAKPPRHWALAIADHLQQVVYLVDSTHEEHYRFRFLEWKNQADNPYRKWKALDWQPSGLPQSNSWSCGHRVLAYTRYLMMHFMHGGYIPEEELQPLPEEYPVSAHSNSTKTKTGEAKEA